MFEIHPYKRKIKENYSLNLVELKSILDRNKERLLLICCKTGSFYVRGIEELDGTRIRANSFLVSMVIEYKDINYICIKDRQYTKYEV